MEINELYIKNKTYEIMDLFTNQISRSRAADLTLCSLLYKWVFDTQKLYSWKLPNKIEIKFFQEKHFVEKFISNIKFIEMNNEFLDNIFTYLSINDLRQVYLNDWSIFINAYNNIDFSNSKSTIVVKKFFDEFMSDLDSFNEKNEVNVTPKCIKKLVTEILNPKENKSIADITSGTGGFLYEITEFFTNNNINPNNCNYYAQDINSRMIALTKLRFLLSGIININVKRGDTLQEPFLHINKKIMKFDYIISDYPFNLTDWSINKNPNINFLEKTSNIRYVDWALNQYVINALKDSGKAAVVMSKGSLIRSQEVFIRQYIVEEDLIESIILLPSSLYFGTSIPVCIIIFNKSKPKYRKEKIQFIDGTECFVKLERNRKDIPDKYMTKIVNVYKNEEDYKNFSALVNIADIRDKKYNLNSTEYIGTYMLKGEIKDSILLKDVAEVKKGINIPKKDIQKLKEWPTHYYINLKDIENGEINYEQADRIETKSQWLERALIQSGDIIVSARGYGIKIALVDKYVRPAIISDNLLIIRIKSDNYDSRILKKYLDSPLGKKFLESIQTGSATVKVITPKNIEKLPIPKIEKECINKLAQLIDSTDKDYKEAIKQAEDIYKLKTKEIYMKMNIENVVNNINKE